MSQSRAFVLIEVLCAVGGLLIDALTYFGVVPADLSSLVEANAALLYLLGSLLVFVGVAFITKRLIKKVQQYCKAKQKDREEDGAFQESFKKTPYWIKAFLKTILDKGMAYSDADSPHLNCYSDFIFQFVDYETMPGGLWRYTMTDDARLYFDKNSHLLSCVNDNDVCMHARKEGEKCLARFSKDFYWWYYSDEDYIEPEIARPSTLSCMGL